MFLSKVPAGTKWAPEGGDTFQEGDEVLLRHDAVDVLAADTEVAVIVWEKGKYQNLRARF